VNQKLLLGLAALAPDHKATSYGSYQLHSWTHKDCRKGPRTVVGTFYKPDVMVFAGCEEIVKAALDVLDGKSAGIAGTTSPLAGRTLPGSIFVARASAIDPKTRCPILKSAESLRVALGESKGESFYRGRVVMKSTESAEQVKAVVEGFRALVSLQHGSDPLAMKLIGGLKVTSEGAKVSIRWNASANDVWAAVEKAAKKWAELKARRHGHTMPPAAGAGKGTLHGDLHKSKPQPKHEEDEF
jgi:hypothetical protein